MTIGTIIKKLRRERDITQERLAEYLGVSSQAVSQWECDKCAPDISVLPPLANIFDVTTDELLGVENVKNKERINGIIEEARGYYAKAEYQKSAAILDEGLRRFPKSFRIMTELANSLSMTADSAERVISLCMRIIDECTDTELRFFSYQIMILQYSNLGQTENALKYARQMPHACYSREDLLMFILKGNEGADNLRDYVKFLSGRLMVCLTKLSELDKYNSKEKMQLLAASVAVGEAVYCDGDYHFEAQFPSKAYLGMAEVCAESRDSGGTLANIRKACAFAEMFDSFDENAENTSPAVRGNVDGKRVEGETLLAQTFAELDDTRYDFVRSDIQAISTAMKRI